MTSGPLEYLCRYRDLIDDWSAFSDAVARPLPQVLWTNTSRIAPADLAALLQAEGLEPEPLAWQPETFRFDATFKPGRHWWYRAGLAHAQEEVSQLPVPLLDARANHRVLDLCAAPGGKTAQIALVLGNRGTLVANDINPGRIKALQDNLDRLGIINTSTLCMDGASLPPAIGGFERILVDAPCSSEGQVRRDGSILQRWTQARLTQLRQRQRALLQKACQLLLPGGRLVYSTCTFAPEENELQIAELLNTANGALELEQAHVPRFITAPGLTQWQGRSLDPSLARCLRIWPHHNDTGGFFIAVVRKSASVADGLPPVAPAELTEDNEWRDRLLGDLGIPRDAFAGYRLHRQTRRGLHLLAADHQAPPLGRESSGMFVYATQRQPKITTVGAMFLGTLATERRISLSLSARDAYLRRETLPAGHFDAGDCIPGQVIVDHAGVPLGIALLQRSGGLESLYPKRWTRPVGCAEFDG